MGKPGATRCIISDKSLADAANQGTVTSQYPEKKLTVIPPVAASKQGTAQSHHHLAHQENGLESPATAGNSQYPKMCLYELDE